MKKKYTSVAQMVRETTEAPFADAFEERIRARRIVKDLMVLRASRGLSQADVAEKMGCTQSRISKLESARDIDLTLGDLAKYAGAVGYRLGVVLEPKERTAVGRVKKLAFQIKDELERLAGLAHADEKIAQGVAGFFNEAFFNLVGILQESAKKLPCDPKGGEPLISFEVVGSEPGSPASEPAPAARPDRKSSRLRRGKVKPAGV